MQPNLFAFATSELSQEAIICWLASWATAPAQAGREHLRLLGQDFLRYLFARCEIQAPRNIETLKIERQAGSKQDRIDILLTVNGDYVILIEHKNRTTEHSDQLLRYRAYVCGGRGVPEDKLLPIYLQTGDQDFEAVEYSGFKVVRRADLLTVLESPRGRAAAASSDILADFTATLRAREDEVQAFRTRHPAEWSDAQWQGFYAWLQETTTEKGNWHKVVNARGGFWGYYWFWHGDDRCKQYLQLEEERLCFRIHVPDPAQRRELMRIWHKRCVEACAELGLRAVKPRKFQPGNYMTVAILDQEYRPVDATGRLDTAAVLQLLGKGQEALSRAVAAAAEPLAD